MKNSITLVVAVVALIIAAFSTFAGTKMSFGSASACTDGYTCVTNLETQGNSITDGTFKLGSTGTTLNSVITGTCTGIVYSSLAATTTQPIDCAVTGALTTAKSVSLGAPVMNGLDGGSIYGNLLIWGGHASTTAGYVEAYITNLTGVATTSFAQATTSIPFLVVQ